MFLSCASMQAFTNSIALMRLAIGDLFVLTSFQCAYRCEDPESRLHFMVISIRFVLRSTAVRNPLSTFGLNLSHIIPLLAVSSFCAVDVAALLLALGNRRFVFKALLLVLAVS